MLAPAEGGKERKKKPRTTKKGLMGKSRGSMCVGRVGREKDRKNQERHPQKGVTGKEEVTPQSMEKSHELRVKPASEVRCCTFFLGFVPSEKRRGGVLSVITERSISRNCKEARRRDVPVQEQKPGKNDTSRQPEELKKS